MKMSRRERTLLLILFISVVSYLFYSFIYTPQVNKANELEKEIELNQVLMQAHLDARDKIPTIEAENQQLSADLVEKLSIYLSKIEQEDIIIYIHETLENNTNVDVSSLVFIETELIENNTIESSADEENKVVLDHEKSSVNIPFEGSYQEVMLLLNEFWNFEKNIVIESLQISTSDEGVPGDVSGTFKLDFISVLDPLSVEIDLVEWIYENVNNTDNPFFVEGKNYFYTPNYNYLK